MEANQLELVVVDKQKQATRKKEHKKLKKYQGFREELKKMWGGKVRVVPVIIGGLGAVTPKLGEWLQ